MTTDISGIDRSEDSTETREHTPSAGPARIPKRIGQYSIKRAIASGGMGTVYEALQEKPRRTVAVKLMRAGIASRSAFRRFEYESQMLARLQHPGIASAHFGVRGVPTVVAIQDGRMVWIGPASRATAQVLDGLLSPRAKPETTAGS